MPLVKAQCTNCGGTLDVDSSKEAAVCPYCNTAYIVEKAINQYRISHANITVQNATISMQPDADTLFENWLITKDRKIRDDFARSYATDPRYAMIDLYTRCYALHSYTPWNMEEIDRYEAYAKSFLTGPRFGKYLSPTLNFCKKEREMCAYDERRREQEKAEEEAIKESSKKYDPTERYRQEKEKEYEAMARERDERIRKDSPNPFIIGFIVFIVLSIIIFPFLF